MEFENKVKLLRLVENTNHIVSFDKDFIIIGVQHEENLQIFQLVLTAENLTDKFCYGVNQFEMFYAAVEFAIKTTSTATTVFCSNTLLQ